MSTTLYAVLFIIILPILYVFIRFLFNLLPSNRNEREMYIDTCDMYTSYFIKALIVCGVILCSIAASVQYKKEITSKKSDVSEVIYISTDRNPRFEFKYSDKDRDYSVLPVVYQDNIDIPYIGNIVCSDITGIIKITDKALILDSSLENYGDVKIYSAKDTNNKLVYIR